MVAQNAAVNYNYERSHTNKTFDNVGWVHGTKQVKGEWGAYLWTLQNRIAFKSSATNVWVSSNGISVAISNVFVGSLSNYPPMADVIDIGPDISPATNFPGEGESDSGTYYADITNIYYQLIIPGIWITPRDVVVAAGSSNAVRFTVTGTNITNGVEWTINPSGLSGGAEMQTNGYWYYRDVMPGNVGTNYKIRAAASDNLYDEVNLTVCKVEFGSGFDRVAPTKTQTVSVTTMPSPLPSGVSVSISADRTYGSEGAATPSPSTITCSTNVNVIGGEQSWGSGTNAAPTNMVLVAQLLDCSVTNGTPFTVCAHATSITAEYDREWGLTNAYGFVVKLVVTSDSDNTNDLDKVYMREKLNRHASQIPDPPFIVPSGWTDNDVLNPEEGYPCPSRPDDPHLSCNGDLRMTNLTYGSFTVDQTWQWECRRCSKGTWHDDTHYTITRTVGGTNENWTITIEQSGVTNRTYNIVP